MVPHFDLPFRLDGLGHAVVADQDTLEDVSNCVQAIVLTMVGQRQELTTFGIGDYTLHNQPIAMDEIINAVIDQEPRAVLVMSQAPDQFDAFIAQIMMRVSTKGAS